MASSFAFVPTFQDIINLTLKFEPLISNFDVAEILAIQFFEVRSHQNYLVIDFGLRDCKTKEKFDISG